MMIATTMNAAISEERDQVFLTGALQRWRRAEVMAHFQRLRAATN
jgi:hypothetical protein